MPTDIRRMRFVLAATLLLVAAFYLPVLAQQNPETVGTIEGRVVDRTSGDPLPGAKVTVSGTNISTSTDREGNYTLARVPVGAQTLLITYLGRRDETAGAEVTSNGIRRVDVQMSVVS